MKTYNSMKSSNVLWLGDIPEHWELKRNIAILAERNELSEQGEEQLLSLSQYTGITIRGKNAVKMGMHEAESLVGYKIVHENDIVMNIMLAWNGSTAKSQYNGIISPAYAVYHLIDNSVNPDYLHYLYKTPHFMQYFEMYSTGLIKSRLRLYPQSFLHLSTIVPPREEQDRIVRFLDWKVSEINRLINCRKRQIERLEELKKAVVSRAVTRGLNPDAGMKNSGVNWIGNIPEHWEIIKIKWLFDESDEKNIDETAELLTFSKKRGLIPFSETSDKLPSAKDLSNYKIIHKGQLLENRMQAWHGMFICADKEGCVSPDYSVFSASKYRKLSVKFYEYVFRCDIWVEQFSNASRGVGSGFNRLYTPQFEAIYTVYPEINEQQQIVAYLDEQCKKIDSAIANKQKQIETLQELKTRLISDVVTGKTDVREIAIPEYVHTEESGEFEERADEE